VNSQNFFGDNQYPQQAQLHKRPQGDMFHQRPGEGSPHKGMGKRRLEQLRMVKLLELLDMDEEKETEFLPVFRSLRKAKIIAGKERNKIIKKLSVEVRSKKLDDDRILEFVTELKEFDAKKQKEIAKILNRIETILTPVQLGKLYIFQARFGAEVLGKMRGFKGKNRQMMNNPNDSI
jgi:hypothetical protein